LSQQGEKQMTNAQISKLSDLWTTKNNAGEGYAPYTDVPGDNTVASAVEAAEADGWTVASSPDSTSEITILRNGDGELMGIGGDGSGNGAWACDLGSE
jgi:hypothetical protein